VDRIPRACLENLFGDGIHDALDTIERERERVARGGQSDLMDLLTTEDMAKQYRLEVFDDG
ncbi:MAG: respiratory nitrate reductase subunit beta, partial [Haloarculaceae archaeon]